MRLLFLTCIILPGILSAQPLDPWLSYLLCVRDSTADIGGSLGCIQPTNGGFERIPASVRGSVQFAAAYDDYQRTGGLESSGASFSRYASGGGYIVAHRPTVWSVRVANERALSRLSIPSGHEQQSVTISQQTWLTSVEAMTEWRGVRGFAAVRLSDDNGPETSCGIGTKLGHIAEAEVLWQERSEVLESSIAWHDELALVRLKGRREGLIGWLALFPQRRLSGELRITRHNWARCTATNLDAILLPYGDEESYHGFIALRWMRGIARAGLRGSKIDMSAYGFKGDYPFAKITRGDVSLRGEFVSFEHASTPRRSWIAEIEHLSWKASARGHVEFWPFASGLLDLLGLRRYFIAETRGDLWRGHVAIRRSLGRRWSGAASVHIADAHLDGSLQHWRPEFLGFGKADEQWHTLRVYRVLGGLVSGTLGFHPGRAQILYSFYQVVPLRLWRHTPPMAAPPNSKLQEGKRSKAYGGALHLLTIGWSF